jgi:DinB family protein
MDACLQKTKCEIEEATRGMTPEQLGWHPDGKWSASEVLEHLALAFGGTAKMLERVAESGKPAYSRKTPFQVAGTIMITGLGIFPGGRTAPAMVTPKGADPGKIVEEILTNLQAMDRALAECDAKFGCSQKIADHPVLGAFNVRQWRRFHFAHTRHHMKQIQRLRMMQSLPS